ncbi:hypothetical protein ABID82_005068 [Methylobacterium sp. PvP062]
MLRSAVIIEDSVSPQGERLTTVLLSYSRFVHSEMMTHRVFSRNGRSSRAVPTKRLLAEPIVEPLFYGSNKSGMAAGEELTGWRYWLARAVWVGTARLTKLSVRLLHFAGLHKQWANRPLEWFGKIDVLVTSTDWANFFALRDEAGAQPEIEALARAIKAALDASSPRVLQPGQWHMPFVTLAERETISANEQLVLSTARCARLTIEPFDGNADYEAEKARFERLVISKPVHASPAEHQATPDVFTGLRQPWKHPHLHGNFRGWIQHRKLLDSEAVFDQPYAGKALFLRPADETEAA